MDIDKENKQYIKDILKLAIKNYLLYLIICICFISIISFIKTGVIFTLLFYSFIIWIISEIIYFILHKLIKFIISRTTK